MSADIRTGHRQNITHNALPIEPARSTAAYRNPYFATANESEVLFDEPHETGA